MAIDVTKGYLPVVTAFVSYSHLDREFGSQVKAVLEEVGIETFLAHEDLEVSEEWQQRILAELRRCDLFVPLLSNNFLASKWAPQEAGFIISRFSEVVLAPLSIDGMHSVAPLLCPRSAVRWPTVPDPGFAGLVPFPVTCLPLRVRQRHTSMLHRYVTERG